VPPSPLSLNSHPELKRNMTEKLDVEDGDRPEKQALYPNLVFSDKTNTPYPYVRTH